jgi:adenylate kinase family enzyme
MIRKPVPSAGLHVLPAPGKVLATSVTIFLLLGPNNSGKTTVGEYLKHLGARVLTTSKLLEAAKQGDHPCAPVIRHYMDDLHENVPCHIPVHVMMDTLEPIVAKGEEEFIILDGMGRTARQIKMIVARLNHLKRRYPHINLNIGFVFLRLNREEIKRRVAARIEKARRQHRKIRATDKGTVWMKRLDVWEESEQELIATAQEVCEEVTIFRLEELTTTRVAARIHSAVHAHESEDDLHSRIRKKFKYAA